MLAARLAGITNVRLVDRSVAAVSSLFLVTEEETLNEEDAQILSAQTAPILFLGLTGQAFEVAILKKEGGRLQQIATGGHWHTGSLTWVHRLVDFAAKKFIETG